MGVSRRGSGRRGSATTNVVQGLASSTTSGAAQPQSASPWIATLAAFRMHRSSETWSDVLIHRKARQDRRHRAARRLLDRILAVVAIGGRDAAHGLRHSPAESVIGEARGRHAALVDCGAFRTPSLRNVSLASPYMHAGSIATLREAVKHELYYSARDRGANFSNEEQEALVAFLRSLTDEEQKR